MKWPVLFCVALCLRYCEGGALKCVPGSQDRSCNTDPEEKGPLTQTSTDDGPGDKAVECLPGSEWVSNCLSCKCSESGRASCQENELCESQASLPKKDEPVQGRECAPGTTWKSRCNTCLCTKDGYAECTRMACPDLERSSVPKKDELLQGKECAPGSTWESQCNSCYCTKQGYSQCTRMGCPDQENEPRMDCAPNTAWKNDCNTCFCTTNGNAMCTRMECATSYNDPRSEKVEANKEIIPLFDTVIDVQLNLINNGIYGYHNILKRSLCTPNQEFKSDCNTCKCSQTGGSYKCTQNECMDYDPSTDVEVFSEGPDVNHVAKQTVCKPMAIFNISCNTCRCNYDGTDYKCTENPCPIPKDVELITELKIIRSSANKSVVCVANRMFIKDCNTCWCNEDGTSYFCTRRVCVGENPDDVGGEETEKLRIIKKECTPNEVFELDCNMCRCNPDGQSYSCTRRACIDFPGDKNLTLSRKTRFSQQDPPKACQPGQEFRMDCNKCLCDNEGQDFSCTRNDCNAENNHQAAALTQSRSKRAWPGSPMAFNQPWPRPGCVRPEEYSHHQQARTDASPPKQKREASEKVSGGCTPGTVFARGCNMCRCSKDGQVAACTLKTCTKDKDEADQQATDLDPSFRCNAGEQFKQDCNDCTCSADGKSVFCTLRLCDMDLTPNIF